MPLRRMRLDQLMPPPTNMSPSVACSPWPSSRTPSRRFRCCHPSPLGPRAHRPSCVRRVTHQSMCVEIHPQSTSHAQDHSHGSPTVRETTRSELKVGALMAGAWIGTGVLFGRFRVPTVCQHGCDEISELASIQFAVFGIGVVPASHHRHVSSLLLISSGNTHGAYEN